jgi:hypothetical protein
MSDASSDNECHLVPIARSGMGWVSVCRGCGNAHLTLEHLTLRFTPDAFRELTGLTVLAQRQLDARHVAQRGASPELASQVIAH